MVQRAGGDPGDLAPAIVDVHAVSPAIGADDTDRRYLRRDAEYEFAPAPRVLGLPGLEGRFEPRGERVEEAPLSGREGSSAQIGFSLR